MVPPLIKQEIQMSDMPEGWPPPITADEQAAMDARDIAWQKEQDRCPDCGCNWVQCQCGDPLEDEAA
jgi:hypothetical protein